jgi:hypothetical protein
MNRRQTQLLMRTVQAKQIKKLITSWYSYVSQIAGDARPFVFDALDWPFASLVRAVCWKRYFEYECMLTTAKVSTDD